MKKLLFAIVFIVTIICGITSCTGKNFKVMYAGADLQSLLATGKIVDFDPIDVNLEDFNFTKVNEYKFYSGEFFGVNSRPSPLGYFFENNDGDRIAYDEYGRVETYFRHFGYEIEKELSTDELVAKAENVIKRILRGFDTSNMKTTIDSETDTRILISVYNNSIDKVIRYGGLIEILRDGTIYRIIMKNDNIPEQYPFSEIDSKAEKWYAEEFNKRFGDELGTEGFSIISKQYAEYEGTIYGIYTAQAYLKNNDYKMIGLVVEDKV